jgi:hypothetical protein
MENKNNSRPHNQNLPLNIMPSVKGLNNYFYNTAKVDENNRP